MSTRKSLAILNTKAITAAQLVAIVGVGIYAGMGQSISSELWIAAVALLAMVEAVFSSSRSWLWISCFAFIGAVTTKDITSIFLLSLGEAFLFIKAFDFKKFNNASKEQMLEMKTQIIALVVTLWFLFLVLAYPEQKEISLVSFLAAAGLRLLDWPLKSICRERSDEDSGSVIWAIKTVALIIVTLKYVKESETVGGLVLLAMGLMGMFSKQKKSAYVLLLLSAVFYKPEIGLFLAPALVLSFGGAVSLLFLYLLILIVPAMLGFVFSIEIQITTLVFLGGFIGCLNSAQALPNIKTKEYKDLILFVLGLIILILILVMTEAGLALQNMTYENLVFVAAAVISEAAMRFFVKTDWQKKVQVNKNIIQVITLLPALRTQEYAPVLETKEQTQVTFWSALGLQKNIIENYFILTGIAAGILWFVVFWWYSNI